MPSEPLANLKLKSITFVTQALGNTVMTSEPSKQISSEILIIHEEVDNTDNCNQENPSLMGLNSPSFLEQNSSQATERSSKIPTVKTTENGNYLRQNLAVDAEDTDVSRTLPRQAERVSFSSINRDSPYTPFPGFQIPNETIIPLETDSPQGKRKKGICAQEAIPVLPRSVAIMCLVLNIAIPGLGRSIFF